MTSALIFSAVFFAAVLATQYGVRSFGPRQILLPLVAVAVVAKSYVHGVTLQGWSAGLLAAGIGIGIVAGLGAAATMKVGHRADGSAYTRAGLGYVGVWLGVLATRLVFVYGAQHWFTRWLGTFSVQHQLTKDSWVVAFVAMAVAVVLTRTAVVFARLNRRPAGSSAAAPVPVATRS